MRPGTTRPVASTLTICLIAGLLGAGVARTALHLVWPNQSSMSDAGRVTLQPLTFSEESDLLAPSDGISTSSSIIDSRLAAYTDAARLDSATGLEARVEFLVGEVPSLARDATLEALLLRYIELNAPRAIRFARDLPVPRTLIAAMFAAWSAYDLDSALGELEGIADRALQRDIATAIVMNLGAGHDVIERVTSVMDRDDQGAFTSELLVRLARTDPAGALHEALELGDYWLRQQTTRRIAAEWVRRDPAEALDQAQLPGHIAPRVRHAFHVDVLNAAARADPDAALAYLTSAAGQELFSLGYGNVGFAVREIAVRRPQGSTPIPRTLQRRDTSKKPDNGRKECLCRSERSTARSTSGRRFSWLASLT